MSELLPCPFCGGEAEMLTAESMHGGNLYGVMCANCAGRSDVYDTEAEAIEAWNTRVDYHGYEQAAIEAWESIKAWNSRAERTCKLVETDRYTNSRETIHVLECSECGETCEHVNGIYPRCPHCGAKVVDE